jgi:CubicO group peptidase (beta-lactamase class C family)
MSYRFTSLCSKGIVLLASLLFFQTAQSQDFSNLNDFLTQKQNLLGKDFVLLIANQNDSVIYKKEAGDFNSKTLAPIASCSKWLTAAIVMSFVDERKISLDDKISRWLPEFEKYGKNYITIRQCLSHMTGIQSEPITIMRLLERKKYNSLEDEVNAFAAKDIQANPGTEFRYSTIGLNIAARICEVVSKKKFEVLAKQRLFIPLNMRKTTFNTIDGGAINPSGGAKSTAEEYLHFLDMMLNKGIYKGNRILSEDAVNEMLKVQTKPELIKYAPKSAAGFNYALGAWVGEEKNGKALMVTSPGLFGTWPVVDYCRNYVYIFFVKNLLVEERAEIQKEMKLVIDEKMKSNCN